MIIKTDNFRKYARLIYVPYDKTSRLKSHIYLDFKNKQAIITGDKMNCAIGLTHDNTEMENFYVSIPEFMALCDAYEELTVTKDGTNFSFSSNNEETFKVSTFQDKKPDMSADDLGDKDTVTMLINSTDMVKLNHSIVFMGENVGTENLAGLKLSNHIYSSDGSRLYEANMGYTLNKSFGLEKELIQILSSLPDDKMEMSITPSGNIVVKSDSVYCVSSITKTLGLLTHDFNNPDFVATYNHDSFIVVSKNELLSILEFFAPFVHNEKNERLILSVVKDKLAIQAKGVNIGTRYIKIKDKDFVEKIADEVWISRNMLYDSISIINDENICIQIGDDDAVAYNITGKDNKDVHISNVLLV